MERDLAVMLERYRQDVPGRATSIDGADSAYYEELVRKEQHDVDSQLVRTYFDFEKVRQGLLEVTGRLFGLRYDAGRRRRRSGTTTSRPTTSSRRRRPVGRPAGESLGRIYLDLHPREGKYKHAAQFTITNGVAGRQLPEGALVCNFSRGLMEHDHVVTLFHEFGHLVHHVLGGHVGVDAVRRRRHRVGLRRGAEPDARGVGLGRRRPADLRDQRRRASRSRPTWSSGCARPTTSARATRPGSRCSTPRCPTGSTPSGRPT